MGRVVVVGSVNQDIVVRVPRLPSPGETAVGGDAVFVPGGKGANQAVAARRLGAETTLYAAVGTDEFGRRLRDGLAANGVDPAHVAVVDGAPTGLALIEVADDGENRIVVSPGANHRLGPLDLTGLRSGDVMLLQLEIPLATCVEAARAANAAGARVVLNAAPTGSADLGPLLVSVDLLVVNETEAWVMVGGQQSEGTATALRRLGPAAAVVTLGAGGAVAADASGSWTQPAFPATVVDTTGAGDAFCGAVAAWLAGGRTLAEAVRAGCAAGAIATSRLGAQSALPGAEDVEALLR